VEDVHFIFLYCSAKQAMQSSDDAVKLPVHWYSRLSMGEFNRISYSQEL